MINILTCIFERSKMKNKDQSLVLVGNGYRHELHELTRMKEKIYKEEAYKTI